MAIYAITSQPKPSLRHPGYHYAYYSKPTQSGRQCVAVFPESIADIIRPGFQFDEDTSVSWDDALKASVLYLDFHNESTPVDEPSLPPDPESGWGDPDAPLATAPVAAATATRSAPQPTPHAPRLTQAPASRRREAEAHAATGAQLPAAYLKINLEVSRSFLLQLTLIGNAVGEARRADVAQKLCAIASIPYYRQMGIELSEDDIKGMTAL